MADFLGVKSEDGAVAVKSAQMEECQSIIESSEGSALCSTAEAVVVAADAPPAAACGVVVTESGDVAMDAVAIAESGAAVEAAAAVESGDAEMEDVLDAPSSDDDDDDALDVNLVRAAIDDFDDGDGAGDDGGLRAPRTEHETELAELPPPEEAAALVIDAACALIEVGVVLSVIAPPEATFVPIPSPTAFCECVVQNNQNAVSLSLARENHSVYCVDVLSIRERTH